MSFVIICPSPVSRWEALIQSTGCEIMARIIPFESSAMVVDQ